MKTQLPLLALALGAASCMNTPTSFGPAESVRVTAGEADASGRVRITLTNERGMEVEVTNLGATVTAVRVPDRDGAMADVTLGFDDLDRYDSSDNQYFGCTVGRVANRIDEGRFELGGSTYTLATNNDPNHLHGGDRGFGVRVWSWEQTGPGEVTFRRTSADGEEGYPGNLEVSATYSLTDENVLGFTLTATTDAATPVSLTNHAYWNLAGHGAPTVLDHELELRADHFTPTDDTLIPTGEIAAVSGALDFREAKTIGRDLAEVADTAAMGFDHNYVLFEAPLRQGQTTYQRLGLGAFDARLRHPASGRTMELYTDQPGLQFYSGNFLFGQTGKGGATYALRSACCLEPQGLPDAVNQPGFPNVVLEPGDPYTHTTALRFGVE